MTTIALVACVGKKLDHPAPAADLYQSAWFRKARRYAEAAGDLWYILSARYCLTKPDQMIEPYNVTLNDKSRQARQVWAADVANHLKIVDPPPCQVVILAGLRYREFLVPLLRHDGYAVEVPMAGLGIGQQLAWLDRNIGRIV
jgi:hypothetical protein